MGANLDITEKLQNYINDFGLNLHPVQQEIINYNKTLGDIKRMQIDPTQCHFLHLIIKVSNIKNVLEIGTFTGLSALSISLAFVVATLLEAGCCAFLSIRGWYRSVASDSSTGNNGSSSK